MKKNIVICIIMIAIFVISSTSIYAQETEIDDVITIGYSPNGDLVSNIYNIGAEGYGYEIIKKIEEITDLKFRFIKVEGDTFEALKNEEVDLIGLNFKTPEREEEFLYSSTPFGAEYISLSAIGNKEIYYNDPQSINGKTVATYNGNPAHEILDKYLVENDISVEFKVGESYNYLEQNADFYLVGSGKISEEKYYTVLNLAKFDNYLVANKGDDILMDALNSAINQIIADEGAFFLELEEKYNADVLPLIHRDLTYDEVEKLKEKTFKVGYIENHRPFTYQDNDGNANGALVEFMSYLSQEYGFNVEYLPYCLSDPVSARNDFDIIISALGSTNNEKNYYQMSESYYSMPLVAMVPKSVSDENNTVEDIIASAPRVGITSYLYINYDFLGSEFESNEFHFFNTYEELLYAYENGEVDMAIYTQSGTTYANAFIQDSTDYIFAIGNDLNFYFSVANDLAEEFIPIFNVMFDNVTETEYSDIILTHTSEYFPEQNFNDFLEQNWYFLVIAFLIAVGIILTVFQVQQNQKKKMLTQAYNTDDLTKIMSIAHFYEKAPKALENSKPDEYELISFDVDMFRTINSYYSMERGTSVILSIAQALKNAFADTDVIYTRRTADQFLILRKVDEGGTIQSIYEKHIYPKLLETIGNNYNLSMSFGSVTISEKDDKLSDDVAHADYARAKGKGKHETTFIVFDENMRKSYESKISITFRMENAVKNREFKLVYQPKVDFKSLEICGAEALVRWFPSDGGVIFPNDFIEVFEQNGFISTLDIYVFEEVARFIKENRSKINIPVISVNFSAITVLEDNITSKLIAILAGYDIKAENIEIEVTESAIIQEEGKFLSKVKLLKKMGFTVSIDDFGAGVSSLNRLSAIDADILKLDKGFFNIRNEGGRSTIVVEEVINLAKHLDMKIVAEGVETYEQAIWLRSLECEMAQGYYFAKPVDEETFKQLLTDGKIYNL